MLPYFWQINTPILSAEIALETEKIMLGSLGDFIQVPHKITKDIWYSKTILDKLPVISKIKSALIYPQAECVGIMNPPHSTTPKHIDPLCRSTLIYIPISPTQGYSRTIFYEDWKAETPLLYATYDEMLPVILNTQVFHGIEYTHTHRLSIHIHIPLPIDDAVKLWNSGLLMNLSKLPL